MHYLLSLIVIAYNSSEYIEDCLNSVFSQTYKDFETVIINNASTDDTDEKIQAQICDKPNVRYIKKIPKMRVVPLPAIWGIKRS